MSSGGADDSYGLGILHGSIRKENIIYILKTAEENETVVMFVDLSYASIQGYGTGPPADFWALKLWYEMLELRGLTRDIKNEKVDDPTATCARNTNRRVQ